MDVRTLQQVLDNVTYCDIESECLDNVDQNYVKLFQLSQLIIEYLLHCQEHLTGTKQTSKHLIDEVEEKHSKALKQIKALESQLAQVTKENRQLKKTVYAYQLWSKVPGGLNNQQPVVSAYHRCRYCPKVFNSEYYLESHLQRRHADRPNYLAETFPIPTAPQTAAKEDTGAVIDKITNTIERFSAKLIETERNLRAEMEAKLESQLNRKEHSMEEQTRQERLTYQRELQDLKVS